jgi:uncharacterized protein
LDVTGIAWQETNRREMHPRAFPCLRCGIDMERHVRRSVETDECPDCKGMWLDSQELATLVGSWKDLPRDGVAPQTVAKAPLICPRCDCALERRTYSEQQRTVVDNCPTCGGIWLDRGELGRILDEVYGLSGGA